MHQYKIQIRATKVTGYVNSTEFDATIHMNNYSVHIINTYK